jgi:hypothetical protein
MVVDMKRAAVVEQAHAAHVMAGAAADDGDDALAERAMCSAKLLLLGGDAPGALAALAPLHAMTRLKLRREVVDAAVQLCIATDDAAAAALWGGPDTTAVYKSRDAIDCTALAQLSALAPDGRVAGVRRVAAFLMKQPRCVHSWHTLRRLMAPLCAPSSSAAAANYIDAALLACLLLRDRPLNAVQNAIGAHGDSLPPPLAGISGAAAATYFTAEFAAAVVGEAEALLVPFLRRFFEEPVLAVFGGHHKRERQPDEADADGDA